MNALSEQTLTDQISTRVRNLSGPAIAVMSAGPVLRSAFDAIPGETSAPVRLVSTLAELEDALDEFGRASRAAEGLESGGLTIRTVGDTLTNQVLVTADRLTLFLVVGETVKVLESTDGPFVESAYEHFQERWTEGSDYSVDVPPLSRLRDGLRDRFDSTIVSDFDAMVADGAGAGLSFVERCVLLAAKNGELLYDIGTWGESVGVANRATFSRAKAALEREGILETEQERVDVGRPRQRLFIRDQRLRELAISDLVRTVDDLRNRNVRGAKATV